MVGKLYKIGRSSCEAQLSECGIRYGTDYIRIRIYDLQIILEDSSSTLPCCAGCIVIDIGSLKLA